MSSPVDIPLPSPEGLPLADANQNNHRKNSAVKRMFKNFTLSRLFARKKASTMDGNPIAQDLSSGNKREEIHEMQVLQAELTVVTELEEPENIPIPETEPQTASYPEPNPEQS